MAKKRKADHLDVPPLRAQRISSTQSYVYDILLPREIRILVLSPGTGDEILRGTLEVVDMNNNPPYKAISYTWGEPVFSRRLYLPQGQLKITESLYGALLRFRSSTEPVRLWADAVCINQGLAAEKNVQVLHMHEVYEQAEEVLVWLGPAKRSDCLAYYLMTILAKMPKSILHVTPVPNEVVEAHNRVRRASIEAPGLALCEQCQKSFRIAGWIKCRHAMRSFADRPWFSRLWIIQEVFCATRYTVHFGHHVIPSKILQDFESAYFGYGAGFGLIERIQGAPNQGLLIPKLPILGILSNHSRDDTVSGVLSMMFRIQHARFTDPHDLVFAVRRIARIESAKLLTPDYGMPIQELWKRVATVELTADRTGPAYDSLRRSRTAVLAVAGIQRKWSLAESPSWVPDFDKLKFECQQKWFFYSPNSFLSGYRAGGSLASEFKVNEGLILLQTRGKRLDRIRCLLPGSQSYPRLINAIVKFKRKLEKTFFERIAEKTLFEPIPEWFSQWITFVWNQAGPASLPASNLPELLFQNPDCWVWPEDGVADRLTSQLFPDHSGTIGRVEMKSWFLHAFSYVSASDHFERVDKTRVLASSAGGYVGWVPQDSRPGDIVVLLLEARHPFVLRPRTDGYYAVIGDAYVQGVMKGEAWPDDNETGVEWIEIK